MDCLYLLAQAAPPPRVEWAPVLVLVVIAIAFAVGTLAMSMWVGPHRTGKGKATTYESGMIPIGDARRRFNVSFYLIAITFVVFDVEIVFFYPWATSFSRLVANNHPDAPVLLAGVILFVIILVIGFAYEWGKGVFRWD